jgi:glutamate synthase domain-containing protein 3
VQAELLGDEDAATVATLLREHVAETASPRAQALLEPFDPGRFVRITTRLKPEPIE